MKGNKNPNKVPTPEEVEAFMKKAVVMRTEVCFESRMVLDGTVRDLFEGGYITKEVSGRYFNGPTKDEVRNAKV